jgi:CRISPR type II-A-associated protein Csn2
MKVVFPEIKQVFSCDEGEVWTIIVENQRYLYNILTDIERQILGNEGKVILSENEKVVRIDKKMELLTQFVPFDMNRKPLLNKIMAAMQEAALEDEVYVKTNELLSAWESLCINLTWNLPGDIEFKKINLDSLIKAAGVEIENEYERLGEKLIDYFELIETYDCKKVFVLLNLRSYIADNEMEAFIQEIIARGYQIILLENKEYSLLKGERRYIIDAGLCEIC